eukprot:scaffold788_cov231-Pinguiococcus_pyrenoidosus.AAC.6
MKRSTLQSSAKPDLRQAGLLRPHPVACRTPSMSGISPAPCSGPGGMRRIRCGPCKTAEGALSTVARPRTPRHVPVAGN